MPCSCWYEPSEENKRIFKMLCQNVVDHIKECNDFGDPLGIDVKHAQELIAHLYNPDLCKEKNDPDTTR